MSNYKQAIHKIFVLLLQEACEDDNNSETNIRQLVDLFKEDLQLDSYAEWHEINIKANEASLNKSETIRLNAICDKKWKAVVAEMLGILRQGELDGYFWSPETSFHDLTEDDGTDWFNLHISDKMIVWMLAGVAQKP